MKVTLLGMVKLGKLHVWKAEFQMITIEVGITTEFKLMHPWKVKELMKVSDVGSVTVTRFTLSINAAYMNIQQGIISYVINQKQHRNMHTYIHRQLRLLLSV